MSMVKICPKCGKQNDKDFVACGKCGTSLDGVTPVDAETQAPVQDTASAVSSPTQEKNSVASALKVIAILTYVGAFILGISLGRSSYGDLVFEAALIYWVAGFVSGTMFLGFSEIVRLLHEINQKIKA